MHTPEDALMNQASDLIAELRRERDEARLLAADYRQLYEAAISVCDERIKEYDTALNGGKGEHCKPGYVRDDIWNAWIAHRDEAIEIKRRITAALAAATTPEGK